VGWEPGDESCTGFAQIAKNSEIERRRAALGGTMRQALKEVNGEYKVIEKTPTKGRARR